MVSKESAVKKYIVTLSDAEREQLSALIHSGKHPAQKLLKARILLKADASGGGEGRSDSWIAAALQTSVDTIARTHVRSGDGAPCGAAGCRSDDRPNAVNVHDLSDGWAPTAGRRGVGGCPDSQAFAEFGEAAHL